MTTRLVTVATFGSSIEGKLAQNLLESEGIRTFLADEMTVETVWQLSPALGGIKLQVDEVDAENARAILAQRRADRAAESNDEYLGLPATSGDDDDEPELSDREQNAGLALRAAVFGLLLFPIEFYCSWLLIKVLFSGERLDRRHRKAAMLAAALNLPFMFLIGVAVVSVI